MSLRVWLPLNGSLDNQGLDNVVVTNNGATIDNNGKIGKCYSFDGNNDKIQISNAPTPVDISIAMWFKRNATTNTRQFLYTQWEGITLELDSANKITCSVYSNGSQGGYCKTDDAITVNSGWVHICFVFKNGVGTKLYINGLQTSSASLSTPIVWGTTIGNIGYFSTYLNGCINDFRIYDHALSPMEVKQISQGLILHYPLNRNGWGNENLALGTDVPHTTTGGKTYTLSDYNLNGKTVTLSCRIDADNITLTGSNQRIGLSLKCTSGSTNYYIEVWKSYRATQISSNGMIAFFGGLSNNSSFHGYISYTFTCPADAVSFGAYTQDLSSGTVKISHVKLEIGDKRTAWCPNSTETLATNYDISNGNVPLGYQELEYIESAGAAWLSTEYIFNPETDSCKVIFKGNDVSHNGMIFGNDPYPYFWIYYYGSNGIRLYARNESNSQQLVTGIASDTNQHTVEYKNKHFYVDGVDKGSLSNTYGACSNPIYLFNRDNSSTYPFKGRIYYVDIKTGSTLKKKFIPVKRTVDSAIGMLETVSGKFYPSMTSTAFTAGTAINIPTVMTYDISGFKNNGVSIGAIGQDGDSPKYGSSAVFGNTGKIVKNSLEGEIYTMSCWVKTTKNKSTSQIIMIDKNSEMVISFFKGCIIGFCKNTNTQSTGSKCILGDSYLENQWNHIVVVKTGAGTRDIYCNGIKLTPTSDDYWSGEMNFIIGERYLESSSSIPFYGYLSDIRIYATALSATDVKELYEYNLV